MHQTTGAPARTAPTFYLTGRQPLRPTAILLAIFVAAAALSSVLFALAHSAHAHRFSPSSDPRSAGASAGTVPAPDADDKDDDPNQIDTIVLGDPADAPMPARRGNHVSPVHATIVVRLPRFGDEVGLIPDSPAGRLLYTWLAAFNQSSAPALRTALSTDTSATAAQIELRKQTGGFALLSAREVQPGLLVFRLRAQPPSSIEVLGTLHLRPDSIPATIASFSLRAVPPPPPQQPTTSPTSPQ